MADYELSGAELDWVEHLQDVLQRLDDTLGEERAIPGMSDFSIKVEQYLVREYSRRRRVEKSRPKPP